MSAVPTRRIARDFDRSRWRTPRPTFADLNARYGPFSLDAAADGENHLCALWLGPGGLCADALLAPRWDLPTPGVAIRVFCNPPYSRGMVGAFVGKAAEQARLGYAWTTLLIPVWTDQPFWGEYVWDGLRHAPRRGVTVEFPRGRVRFQRPDGRPASSPTFPSVFVTIGVAA